jgi:hypothetical protein
MITEFEAINKAVHLSKSTYQNEVLVVFQRLDRTYEVCPESEYTGDEDYICGKYLNGGLAPA